MEKLICPACGAPLTPDSTQPFLTCEYCDTAVENKYYVAPPVVETVQKPAEEPIAETLMEESEEEAAPGRSLLKTLLGVGTAIAANNLRRRATVVRRPAVHPVLRTGHTAIPHRPPEPPRIGGLSARPTRAVRPGSTRPQPGRSRVHGGVGGRPLGPGGRGGRGGMGGPGGRHR